MIRQNLQWNERPYQPCFTVTEECEYLNRVCVCENLCVLTFVERKGESGREREGEEGVHGEGGKGLKMGRFKGTSWYPSYVFIADNCSGSPPPPLSSLPQALALCPYPPLPHPHPASSPGTPSLRSPSTAHCSSSPNTSFCLRFMFSKSKSLPVMRL